MPRPFPPIPPNSPGFAKAARFISDADDLDLFERPTAPWRWTFPLINQRATGVMTADQACLTQLIIIDELRIPNAKDQWAILVVTDNVPNVETINLSERCVEHLIRNTSALRNLVFTRLIRSLPQLAENVRTRKLDLGPRCGADGLLFRDFLDAVASRLAPFVRP